jgi:hypothetical protein
MQLRYQPSPIYSSITIAVLSLIGVLTSNMTVAQEGEIPVQPFFGTVQTDGWAFEVLNPGTDTSIYLPANITSERRMRDIMERISEAEEKPIEFFDLQPGMEVYLFDSKSSTRADSVETEGLIVPLTPCPAGYCLPPWMFIDPLARLSTHGSDTEGPSIPVVDAVDFGKYFRPME